MEARNRFYTALAVVWNRLLATYFVHLELRRYLALPASGGRRDKRTVVEIW